MPDQPEVVTVTITRRTLEDAITCLQAYAVSNLCEESGRKAYIIALKELKAALDAAEMPNFFDKWGTL